MPRPPDVANPGCGTGARGNTIQVDHHKPREGTPADLKKQDSCAPDQERHPILFRHWSGIPSDNVVKFPRTRAEQAKHYECQVLWRDAVSKHEASEVATHSFQTAFKDISPDKIGGA